MSDNTCSICLDHLLPIQEGKEIGATVPCGHCFHLECFGLWKVSSSRGGGTGRSCKCPNCANETSKIVKIFIGQSAGGNEDDDDDDDGLDDLSLSSTEEEEEKEQEDNEEADFSSDIEEIHTIADEIREVASRFEQSDDNVVDLTMSPERPKKQSKSSDDVQRMTKVAKRYKRKYKQKESQFRELFQRQGQLREELEHTTDMFEEADKKLDSVEQGKERLQVDLDGLKVKAYRLSQENKEWSKKNKILSKEKNVWEQKYSHLYLSYQQDLERSRVQSMVEVKAMLEEHPKIIQENHQLKELLSKYKYQHPNKTTSRQPTTTTPTVSAHNKASAIAKSLREMDQARVRNRSGSTSSNNKESSSSSSARTTTTTSVEDASTSTPNPLSTPGKYSAQVTRMLQATEKKSKMQARLQARKHEMRNQSTTTSTSSGDTGKAASSTPLLGIRQLPRGFSTAPNRPVAQHRKGREILAEPMTTPTRRRITGAETAVERASRRMLYGELLADATNSAGPKRANKSTPTATSLNLSNKRKNFFNPK